MLVEQYFAELERALSRLGGVRVAMILKDIRSPYIGYLRAEISLPDDSTLHVREFVSTHPVLDRYTYAYHLQDSTGQLVFRYDNTGHFPKLPGFPHHKHTTGGVVPAPPMDLESAIDEALDRNASSAAGRPG